MNKLVANKLKMYRKQKGWTQEETADFLHLSQSTYARIESGQSQSWASHLEKICKVFQITVEELLKTEETNSSDSKHKLSNGLPLNEISQKLIEQYEERIKELKQRIIDLKGE